ncbi:hypothetical protein C8J55DRAFT_562428 [Lentinula edodes]|uniref:Uncharacterized protein n=1 Tax=Lentinula lateritia TaxID=40482 RepID=A0A9W9A4U6_9AGAR|nr:hypothetical protein C8J55DRAFT_562428 [Lentinula edodes]
MQISECNVSHPRKRRHSDQSDFENTSPLCPATRKCATHAAHAIQCLYNSGVENSQVKSQTWVSSVYQHAGQSVLVDTASSNTQFLQSDNFEGRKGSLDPVVGHGDHTQSRDAAAIMVPSVLCRSISVQTEISIDDLNHAESIHEDVLLSRAELEQQCANLRANLDAKEHETERLDKKQAELQAEVYAKQRESNGNLHRATKEIRQITTEWDSATEDRDALKKELKIVRRDQGEAVQEAQYWRERFRVVAERMGSILKKRPSKF